MYIDVALVKEFTEEYGTKYNLTEIIENCGIWNGSPDSVRFEWEEPEATLEEIFNEYYFIVEDNKIMFCDPETFWDDVKEYLNG